jgi:hypothetical protein
LALSGISAIGSIGLLANDLLRWLVTGTMRSVTIARLIGTDALWLRVPLWIVGAAISVLMLVLFFETWSFAVRRDVALDAARGRAECGDGVEDGMF